MENQDRELVQKIEESIEKLNAVDGTTPDFVYFKTLVDRQQAVVRRRQRIQLMLFVAVALALVSAVILLSGHVEVFFIVLQAAAIGGTIIGLTVSRLVSRRHTVGSC